MIIYNDNIPEIASEIVIGSSHSLILNSVHVYKIGVSQMDFEVTKLYKYTYIIL